MKKCLLCNREFTKNMDDVLASRRFTFAIDDTDPYCESCDARRRASECVRIINANMVGAREIAKNDKIQDPQAYLAKKLHEYRTYWVNWYTEFLKGDDRTKYSYWLQVFLAYIDKHAVARPDLVEIKKEESL